MELRGNRTLLMKFLSAFFVSLLLTAPLSAQSGSTFTAETKLTGGTSAIYASPTVTVVITTTSPLPNCTFSTPFSFTFSASGGTAPYTWSVISGSLQPGLSLSSAGVLSGSCSNSSGSATFTVQACDATTACTNAPFTQTAQNSPPPGVYVCDSTSSPTCPNPPSTGVTGTFYSYNFNAGGGTAPYSWAVTSGAIPTGLTLTSAGLLSGFPNTATVYSFTVTVTDSTTPTPGTAPASFTVTITGANGAPQVAVEPQNWTTIHQGGWSVANNRPCQQSDTDCTYSLPLTCNAAHNCIHEQLGFGSNDHPATLAGLQAAGCDWAQALTSTAAQQGWYMWVEVATGAILAGSSFNSTTLALYDAPVKINGNTSVGCAGASTSTPIGPWTIGVSGSITGNFQLGEILQQATTGAEANLYFYGCTTDAPPVYGRPCGTGNQVGPIQIGPIQNGTADGTHLWTGLSSGATFTPSGSPVANGYFRLTGQCSSGSGSGSPNTPGYPIGTHDTPCNNLANQVPCVHSITDASLVANFNCTNDQPSMFTFEATGNDPHSTGFYIVNQQGNNTSLSGFEVTIATGINQSMTQTPLCNLYSYGGSPLDCNDSPILIQVNCASCFRDHYWAHGRDPGDPAGDPVGDIGQEAFATAANYPVDPTTGHHECPSWAYYSTNPAATGNPPVALSGNQLPYSSGCGDDVLFGVSLHSGGYTADEYVFINKIHGYQQETHTYQIGNGADNLNPTPPPPITPGTVNVGGNGLNGPHKVTECRHDGNLGIALFRRHSH